MELYKAIIKLDRYTKEDEKKLLEYMSRLPNIHYFIRNIWQIEPELVVSNYQEYYEIIENLKKEFLKKWCKPDTTDESVIWQFNKDLEKLEINNFDYCSCGNELTTEKWQRDKICRECI